MSSQAPYRLYYSPFACSFAVHAALEKIAIPVELIKVDIYKQEHLSAEFKQLNPQTQVPVLQHEGMTITQASAILLYLSEQHPTSGLMPSQGSADRPKALEMLLYFSNTLHPYFSRMFNPERLSKEAPHDVKKMGIEKIEEALQQMDHMLSQQLYSCGDTLYAPDYYLFAMLNWVRFHPVNISNLKNIKGFIKRMKTHPEVQSVLAKEMQSMAA